MTTEKVTRDEETKITAGLVIIHLKTGTWFEFKDDRFQTSLNQNNQQIVVGDVARIGVLAVVRGQSAVLRELAGYTCETLKLSYIYQPSLKVYRGLQRMETCAFQVFAGKRCVTFH